MDQALDFVKTHLWIAVFPVLFLLFFFLRLWMERRKARKQQENMRQLQRRDEALNEALRNPRMKHTRSVRTGPMEVTWDEHAADSGEKKAPVLMIELVEHSAYARRTYVFPADTPVSVGSGPENQLLLSRDGVAERHCLIFMNGSRPCVRNLSGSDTTVKRGKEIARVGEGGVYLNNGDRIQLGGAAIQFRLFKV